MTKVLKKEHHVVVAHLYSLYVQTSITFAKVDLQIVINNHSKVFGELPKSLPLAQDHDYNIPPTIPNTY